MMGTITVVFVLCVAPYFVYFLAPGKAETKEKILPYIVMLMYLNSVINPLLYIKHLKLVDSCFVHFVQECMTITQKQYQLHTVIQI